MTTEGVGAVDASAPADEDQLFCYRHPERETFIRCGRCDRSICTRCAIQGPVGFRCRQCGQPARDPLTSFTPAQAATGGGVALLAGLVSGFAGSMGLLGLCVALFAGGLAAETIRRQVGYKRGPALSALVLGGLLIGTFAGYAVVFGGLWLPTGVSAGGGPADGAFIAQTLGSALLIGAVACIGAQSRLR